MMMKYWRLETLLKNTKRLPDWFNRQIMRGKEYFKMLEVLERLNLNTVCEEARCPNESGCFSRGTATFLIMGNNCTRNCRFCAIAKRAPQSLESDEPKRIAIAVKELGLKYAVITSVTRDDLIDGGAAHFGAVVREILRENRKTKVEVLIPDFQGDSRALQIVLDAGPCILNHNLETVPRLYQTVRPEADYKRSLKVLEMSKIINPEIPTKSGLMLGLGETKEEIVKVMEDLLNTNCDLLTMGQYLAPSKNHLPVERYVLPQEFEELGETAIKLGFRGVASAPLARSSYLAEKLYKSARR